MIFESTTAGDFPPSSSTTGVRCFAAADITMRPTLPLPKNSGITYAKKHVSNLNETIHLYSFTIFSLQIMHLFNYLKRDFEIHSFIIYNNIHKRRPIVRNILSTRKQEHYSTFLIHQENQNNGKQDEPV